MPNVSCSRLRIYRAGGRFGAGGTALDAAGEIAIAHGLTTPRTCGVELDTMGPAATQNNRWPQARISGTVVVAKVLSAHAAAASVTAQGYWWAQE